MNGWRDIWSGEMRLGYRDSQPHVSGALLAAMLVLAGLAAIYFAWPVYRAFLPMQIEGGGIWQAYHADALREGLPLYSFDVFITNNYPPLSFYLLNLLSSVDRLRYALYRPGVVPGRNACRRLRGLGVCAFACRIAARSDVGRGVVACHGGEVVLGLGRARRSALGRARRHDRVPRLHIAASEKQPCPDRDPDHGGRRVLQAQPVCNSAGIIPVADIARSAPRTLCRPARRRRCRAWALPSAARCTVRLSSTAC